MKEKYDFHWTKEKKYNNQTALITMDKEEIVSSTMTCGKNMINSIIARKDFIRQFYSNLRNDIISFSILTYNFDKNQVIDMIEKAISYETEIYSRDLTVCD